MPASLEYMLSELETVANEATRGPWSQAQPLAEGMERDHVVDFGVSPPNDPFAVVRGANAVCHSDISREQNGKNAKYISTANPAFALELIAAVRSALSPSTELPERPDWIYCDGEKGYPCDIAHPHFDSLESLLRAANAEVGRLKGELEESNKILRETVYDHVKRDEQLFSDLGLNTSEGRHFNARAEAAESALATTHASSVQQGRKECANLAFAPDYPRAPQGSVQQAFNAGLSEYHRRILALGPVSPASDPRREQMEIAATFMCGMCAEGLPVDNVDGRFMHNHTLKLECRAAPLRAHFERQAVLAFPEAK